MKIKKFLRLTLIPLIVVFLLNSSLLKAQDKSITYLRDTLDKIASQYINNYDLHGLSYSIILKNDSIIYNSLGPLNNTIEIDTSLRWMFASCTKNIISTAILDLQEQGLLSINDALYKYFTHPNIDSAYTIKQLLNHTTNFSEFNATSKFFYEVITNPEKIWTAKEVLDSLVTKNSSTQDNNFRYCNTNYLILGLVIEKVTGNSLNEVLSNRYFNKLGMNKTSLAPDDYSFSELAGAWYDTDGDGNFNDLSQWANEPLNATLSTSFGSGNIVSTPLDMAKWVKKLYKGEIISNESLLEMKNCAPGSGSNGVARGYGLGMEHLYFSDCNHIGHSGHEVYTSTMFYCPELDISLALVLNEPAETIKRQLHVNVFNIVKEYYSNPTKH